MKFPDWSQWPKGNTSWLWWWGTRIESYCAQLCVYHECQSDIQPWARAAECILFMPRSSQPSILCWLVKCLSAFELSINKMAMVGADNSSLQASQSPRAGGCLVLFQIHQTNWVNSCNDGSTMSSWYYSTVSYFQLLYRDIQCPVCRYLLGVVTSNSRHSVGLGDLDFVQSLNGMIPQPCLIYYRMWGSQQKLQRILLSILQKLTCSRVLCTVYVCRKLNLHQTKDYKQSQCSETLLH